MRIMVVCIFRKISRISTIVELKTEFSIFTALIGSHLVLIIKLHSITLISELEISRDIRYTKKIIT